MYCRSAAIVAGAAAAMLVLPAVCAADQIDLGTLSRTSSGYVYTAGSADFSGFFHSNEGQPAQIDIDLGGLLASQGEHAFISVTVLDTGSNTYTEFSSGADIDLFTFSGLSDDAELAYVYSGPNENHWDDTPEQLATRVGLIDAVPGATENTGDYYVSLGPQGALTAQLSTPQGGGIIIDDGPASDIGGIFLHLSEAGVGESFRILVTPGAVPAPGALAMLGMAGLIGRRRRR